MYKCVIDQAGGQYGWTLAEFLFCVLIDLDVVEFNNNVKKNENKFDK